MKFKEKKYLSTFLTWWQHHLAFLEFYPKHVYTVVCISVSVFPVWFCRCGQSSVMQLFREQQRAASANTLRLRSQRSRAGPPSPAAGRGSPACSGPSQLSFAASSNSRRCIPLSRPLTPCLPTRSLKSASTFLLLFQTLMFSISPSVLKMY